MKCKNQNSSYRGKFNFAEILIKEKDIYFEAEFARNSSFQTLMLVVPCVTGYVTLFIETRYACAC